MLILIGRVMGPVILAKKLLNASEKRFVHNRFMFSGKKLVFVAKLPDIKRISQDLGKIGFVTQVRLVFENLGFCKDWKSERLLRAGTKGGHKVPDGFFIPNQKGIAVEVELKKPKKASRYREIFEVYDRDPKIGYIFYICGSLRLLTFIRRLVKKAQVSKLYCFMLYDDLVKSQEKAMVQINGKEFSLKRILNE